MSSICGIVDFESSFVDFNTLKDMGKAMVLRGKDQSGAYISRGVGLQHDRMVLSEASAERQPHTVERDGRVYTVVFDGELYNMANIPCSSGLLGFNSAAEAVIEGYIAYGYKCVEYLDGIFAFAIYDEEKREVFLARDSIGAKPLYYLNDGRRLVFASEIKGILRYLKDGVEIDRGALCELITSPLGMIGATELYRGIKELPESAFAIHSRLGTQVGEYLPSKSLYGIASERRSKEVFRAENTIKCESLPSVLNEALVAFDHPAFDEFMCGYLNLLKGIKGIERAVIEDSALSIDFGYAMQRADRLGMMNGILIETRSLEEEKKIKNSVLYRAEKFLLDGASELICGGDSYVSSIFGGEILESIKRERDIRRRIRSYGMIIQAERWIRSYPIIFVK